MQFTFSRSEDRIYQAEHSVTRCSVTKEEDLKKERTFGRKSTTHTLCFIPYARFYIQLYAQKSFQ